MRGSFLVAVNCSPSTALAEMGHKNMGRYLMLQIGLGERVADWWGSPEVVDFERDTKGGKGSYPCSRERMRAPV